MIFYPATGGEHIMMVLDVEYVSNSRVTTIDRVKIIEATKGFVNNKKVAKVVKVQNLSNYSSRDWIIVRLKPIN
jgi:hypothetical protein